MRTHSIPNQVIGILFKIASTLAFTAMATLVKLLSDGYPTGELVFFRSAFALIPVIVWVAWRENLATIFHTQHFGRHMLRCGAGAVAMFSGFTALSLLPFADATAISYAAPLLTVVLAVVLLGEKVRMYRWSAVAVGMVGVLVILSDYLVPGADRSVAGALLALFGASSAAFAATQARILVRTDSAATTVAIFSVVLACISALTFPLGWNMPGAGEAGLLILTGIFGGLGQVFLTTSFRYGDASTIAPFDYLSMVWALTVSLMIFGTWPTTTVLAGTVIVVGAGLFVIFREHSLGIERAKAKRAQTPTTPLT